MWSEWNETFIGIALDSSLRATIAACVVGLILVASRVRASNLRHKAWTAVMLTMLLMPALRYWTPSISGPRVITPPSYDTIPLLGKGGAREDSVISPNNALIESPLTPPVSKTENQRLGESDVTRSNGQTNWISAGLLVYATGLLFMAARLLLGWRAIKQLLLASQRIDLEPRYDPNDTYESAAVAAPVTIGAFAPRMILPADWRLWPEYKLRAVLAHESAHIRRRDPLVGLLARINRLVFWFHPLSWWLERKLAATAEHACDDAVVRGGGAPREYAQTLLDMADAVRRSSGRLSWQGLRMDGNGSIGERIDRILSGHSVHRVSNTRKMIVGFTCVIAIALIVACRQQAAPLRPDPEFTRQQAARKAEADARQAARNLKPSEVAELEANVKQNPEDLEALKKLLILYGPDFSGKPIEHADKIIAARRPLILWLIEHHPESDLAGSLEARIFPTSLDPLADPAGYAQAKKLWLAQTERPGVTTAVLRNAARFFDVGDKPLAERMLLRAQALDPKPESSRALGDLYAYTVSGSNSFTLFNVVRTFSLADAHSAYAEGVRRKLAESTDQVLLAAAGERLAYWTKPGLDFDNRGLGRSYIERAVQLDPQSQLARRLQSRLNDIDLQRKVGEIQRLTGSSQNRAVEALPEPDRFMLLPRLAEATYISGESIDYYKKDQTEAKAAWDLSRQYALDLLALAPKFQNHPGHSTALFSGNMTLATVAMRNGDKKTAVKYLREAAKTPASDELSQWMDVLVMRVCRDLLKYGERDSVADFLERYAQLNIRSDMQDLVKAAAAVRNGVMPAFYQRYAE